MSQNERYDEAVRKLGPIEIASVCTLEGRQTLVRWAQRGELYAAVGNSLDVALRAAMYLEDVCTGNETPNDDEC